MWPTSTHNKKLEPEGCNGAHYHNTFSGFGYCGTLLTDDSASVWNLSLFIQDAFQTSTWHTSLSEEPWKPPNYQLYPLRVLTFTKDRQIFVCVWVTFGGRDLNKVRRSLLAISSEIPTEPSWEPSTSLWWQQAGTVLWVFVAVLEQCLIGELPIITVRNRAIYFLKITYNTCKY